MFFFTMFLSYDYSLENGITFHCIIQLYLRIRKVVFCSTINIKKRAYSKVYKPLTELNLCIYNKNFIKVLSVNKEIFNPLMLL